MFSPTRPSFNQWNAHAHQYEYEELQDLPGRFFIRVFDLEPGSKHSPIMGHLRQIELLPDSDRSFGYTALSYTWGNEQDLQHEICVDNRILKIRDNLYNALMTLRHEHDVVTLWIDAICINQPKIFEKNRQVSMMSIIYKMAERTKIWLGSASLDSARAFEYMKLLDYQSDGQHNGVTSMVLDAFRALLVRPYWRRAWILQEVFLSYEIDVHCGSLSASWTSFSNACDSLRQNFEQHVLEGPVFHLMHQRSRQNDEQQHLQTLESLIRNYSRAMASDVRDKVFALLSLACDCAADYGLQVDYSLPRFHLLLKVVECCKPKDPVGLIHILFEAFELDADDIDWINARNSWRRASTSSSNRPRGYPATTWLIRIDHYTTRQSSLGSDTICQWPSLKAFVDLNWLQSVDAPVWHIIRKNQTETQHREFPALKLDERAENWLVMQDTSRVTILSTSEISAVVNPCGALGLHEFADDCTREHCVKAYRIIKFRSVAVHARDTAT